MAKRAAVLMAVAAVAIAAAAIILMASAPVPDVPGGHGGVPTGQRAPAPPSIDWDHPIVGVTVASSSEAYGHLSFTPTLPVKMGAPLRIMVDDAHSNRAGRQIAWVFQHPIYGRFVLTESITTFTQASLDALSDCTKSTGGCQGTWTRLPLNHGRHGLLITGGPTTGILWIENGVTFDVYGPVDTFAVTAAQAVANNL